MTPSDMEAMVNNVNVRTTRIEHILPSLATKDDLGEAIRKLSTKEDLKAFATKEDLKPFATKEDLTKGMAESKRYTQILFEDLKGDIRLLAEHLAHISQIVESLGRRQ